MSNTDQLHPDYTIVMQQKPSRLFRVPGGDNFCDIHGNVWFTGEAIGYHKVGWRKALNSGEVEVWALDE